MCARGRGLPKTDVPPLHSSVTIQNARTAARPLLENGVKKKKKECYGRTAPINVDAEHKTLQHLRIISIYTVVSFILLKRQVDQYNIAPPFFFTVLNYIKSKGKGAGAS